MPDLICQNQETIAYVGGALYLLSVVVRPFVPTKYVDTLGKIGQVIEVLTGNTKHCKNAPAVTDSQAKVTPR